MSTRPSRLWVRSRDMADAVAQWEAAREAAAAREVDRLLAELFGEES